MRRSTALLLLGAGVLTGIAAGCAGRTAETSEGCAPPAEGGAALALAAGDYQLTLVATSGDSTDRTVSGHLQLSAPPDSLLTWEGRGTPLVGFTHIDLGAVAALTLGDLTATDPWAPGVIVFSQGEGPATIRFGSLANQRDVLRFDGGFTALQATESRGDGFAGTWASGAMGPEAGGHFCAVVQVAEGQ